MTIRLLDKRLDPSGYGYAIIELTNGRFAEALVHTNELQTCILPQEPFFWQDAVLTSVQWEGYYGSVVQRKSRQKSRNKHKCELDNMLSSNHRSPSDRTDRNPSMNILNAFCDDILQEIFEYLPLDSLCSVADTCKRFNSNAQQIFLTKFAKLTPEIDDLCHLESLLRNFGHKIESLSIQSLENSCSENVTVATNALPLILAIYCSDADSQCRLQKLNFTNFHLDPSWHEQLRPVFRHIKQLRLEFSRSFDLIGFCDQLTELVLVSIKVENASNEMIIKKIGTLEKLTLSHCDIPDNFFDAMERSETLKVLEVHHSNGLSFEMACSKFPKLAQLELYSGQKGWGNETVTANDMKTCFGQMTNLTKLGLNGNISDNLFGNENVVDLLNDAGVAIEWLVVANSKFDLLEHARRLKDVQILEIITLSVNVFGMLINLIKELPKLKELLIHNHDLSKNDVMELIEYGKYLELLRFNKWNGNLIDDKDRDGLHKLAMKRKTQNKTRIEIRLPKGCTANQMVGKIKKINEFYEILYLPFHSDLIFYPNPDLN